MTRIDEFSAAQRRADAEARLRANVERDGDLPASDLAGLVHELRVHQIELELQNDELRLTQLEVESSRDKYQQLFEFAPFGYLSVERNGSIREGNLSACRILNVERELLIGTRIQRYVADSDDIHRILREPGELNARRTCQSMFVSRTGESLHIQLQFLLAVSAADEEFFRVALIDITALRNAEEERATLQKALQHKQRLEGLGILAGGIAHDFNNLLVPILIHTEMIADELGPASPLLEHTAQIEAAAHRSAELCQQMLAYAGKGDFKLSTFSLSEIVRQTSGLVSTACLSNVRVDYDLTEDVCCMEGDVTAVRQIIMNLILNASEAIATRHGNMSVSTSQVCIDSQSHADSNRVADLPAGHYACLEVRDSGCGMTRETQERMFDPFFTTKFAGRGLGMAAVRGIVSRHKGAITVESQPDEGTTVRVYFPASPPRSGQKNTIADDDSTTRPTILIVDDDPLVLQSIEALVAAKGYPVLTAADGGGAIAAVRKHSPEIKLILLDMTMPGLSLKDTCRQVNHLQPELPVLLMSGYSTVEKREELDSDNVVGFVPKPLRDVATTIENVLSKSFQNEPFKTNRFGNTA